MTKEQYVDAKTARLLQEKGFTQQCEKFYLDSIMFSHWHGEVLPKDKPIYECPTQQKALRWLREEHYILVFVLPCTDKLGNLAYCADILAWNEREGIYEPAWRSGDYYIYEEACEAGIQHAAKLITLS